MSCPRAKHWDLLAMELLDEHQVEGMLAHARSCAACREQFQVARREHTDRVRMYEAFDREHDELREQLMAALPDEAPPPHRDGWVSPAGRRLGGLAMSLNKSTARRAATLLLPAACIVIAVVVFLVPKQSAFAAAIEHLRTAKTIVCRITMPGGVQVQGREIKAEGKMYVSAEHGSHVKMFVDGALAQLQYTPVEGPSIMVTPPARSYFELHLDELAPDETAARTPSAWIQKLKELEAEAGRELGRDTIDGHEAVGFEVSGERLGFAPPTDADRPSVFMHIWVDEQTDLPVQMKISVPMAGWDSSLTVVMDQFEWDIPVDAGLFKPDIPSDYVKLDLKFARPSEETLLHTLTKIRELTGGRYTSTLELLTALAELPTLLSESAREGLRGLDQQATMQLAAEIGSGCKYYMQLVRDGHEPEYFGDSVTAEDADQVLLRWKLDDGQVRVIYGDLRVETLPASE